MDFKSFLMEEYKFREKSARDYEGRLNGIIVSEFIMEKKRFLLVL